MRNFKKLLTLVMSIIIVGCGVGMPIIQPFKMDIQQGNVVTSEMLLKLRPGMTRSQVKYILGTPLLADSFHSNRWDYFYQLSKQGKVVNQRRVILDFEGGSLAHVRGDVVPEGADSKTLPMVEPVVKPEPGLVDVKVAEKMEKAVKVLKEKSITSVPSAVDAPTIPVSTSIASERRGVPGLERQLDVSRVERAMPVLETLPEVESKVMPKAREVQLKGKPRDSSLSYQEEPGLFERLLEKIGF
ncbi:MAG: outer membrane protein assembly factor BamE [Methylophilaceae bacterium]|jgi:outer membrane protein assembly factor BamE